MVRIEATYAVRCDVRSVREVLEVLRWHSDLPDFIAVRYLLVELLLRIHQHGYAVYCCRGDLLRKVHFPNYIIVASTTMGSMISLGINLLVVICFGSFAHAHYTWRILLVPLSIIQLYCLGLGVALLLASLFVYFRDVAHIWEVILQAMFYATPIIYPITMVANNPEFSWAAKILMLNPSTQVIMDIRHNLLSPEYVPTVWSMVDNKLLCLLPYALSVFILWLGIHVFRKYSSKFAEVL